MTQIGDIIEAQPDVGEHHISQFRTIMLLHSLAPMKNESDVAGSIHCNTYLTDFTAPKGQSDVYLFKCAEGTGVDVQLQEIKLLFGVGNYLDDGMAVLVNVEAKVSRSLVDGEITYTAISFELVNDRRAVEMTGEYKMNCTKIEILVNRLKAKGYWANIKNKGQITPILSRIQESRAIETRRRNVPASGSVLFQTSAPRGPAAASQILAAESQSQFTFPDSQAINDSNSSEREMVTSSTPLKRINGASDQTMEPGPIKRMKSAETTVEQHSGDFSWNADGVDTNSQSEVDADANNDYTGDGDVVFDQDQYQNRIANVLAATPLDLNESFEFRGYVMGVMPLRLTPFGQSYRSLPSSVNFRLVISNIKPEHVDDSFYFISNRNCLELEFRGKARIMKFFGYNDFDEFVEDKDKVEGKFRKLVDVSKGELRYFTIIKREMEVSNGSKIIWECGSTIDELLER